MELEQNQSYYESAIYETLFSRIQNVHDRRTQRARHLVHTGLADQAWDYLRDELGPDTSELYIAKIEFMLVDLYEDETGEIGIRFAIDDNSLEHLNFTIYRENRTSETHVSEAMKNFLEQMLDDMHEANRENLLLDGAIKRSGLGSETIEKLKDFRNLANNYYVLLKSEEV